MKATRDAGADAEEEARARRQTQLEQRHLEAYRNLHRLRDALYQRYAALLKDKVQSQRLRLQQRHEAAVTKTESDAKQKPKKLAFSKLQHNDSHLKSLPQTRYHLILDLQTQLAERGHLKTHHDLEDFHRGIKYNDRPSELQRSLQDCWERRRQKKLAARAKREDARGTSPEAVPAMSQLEPVSHSGTLFAQSQEQTPSGGSLSGDLPGGESGLLARKLLEQRPGSGEQPAAEGSQQVHEIEQIFPKMKVPTFAALRPNFMEDFRSRMPDLVPPELPEKSRKAEIYMGRLRQMHHLSLINVALSQRLLEQDSGALLRWEDDGGVQGLVLPNIDSKQKQRGKPHVSPPKRPRSARNNGGSGPRPPSSVTSSSLHRFEAVVLAPAACGSKTPDPLCIEDVCQQKHVVIIDTGVKLWRNYT